jgi:hypothetical protein
MRQRAYFVLQFHELFPLIYQFTYSVFIRKVLTFKPQGKSGISHHKINKFLKYGREKNPFSLPLSKYFTDAHKLLPSIFVYLLDL